MRGLLAKTRQALARALAARLGEDWSAGKQGRGDALVLEHGPTRLTFVAIPGGAFDMGLTDADVAAVEATVGATAEIRARIAALRAAASPVRRVRIAPFLLARAVLSRAEVERISDGELHGMYCHEVGRREARRLARALRFRLASEAELQWVAREGGRAHFVLDAAAKLAATRGDSRRMRSRFGVEELFFSQWAEDDFHPTFAGAPQDGRPWMNGDPGGITTGWTMPEYVDEPEQTFGLLAAIRGGPQSKARVRFALDLPSELS